MGRGIINIKLKLSWQGYVVFLGIWLLGASYFLGFWNYLNPPGEWKTVTNELYQFSVDYPTKWSAETYDEHGYKGGDEIKLQIYRAWMDYNYFVITIRQKEASSPTMDDVVKWGGERIKRINRNTSRTDEMYRETRFVPDYIGETRVIMRRYGNEEMMNEDVYIARDNDMIVIMLQAKTDVFDQYLEDFYRIVESFRTLD